jgi:hypothetical protein
MMGNVTVPLEPSGEGVWTAATPVRFAGTWFPHVMTIVRLSDGDLLLHSPCRPDPEILEAVERLGSVRHLVAPNWFHDLYLAAYIARYPDATLWAPRFLARQHRGLEVSVLDDGAQPPWVREFAYVSLSGLWTFDECIFFHVPSGTLVVADLLMNVFTTSQTPWFTKLVARLFRLDGRLQVFHLVRLLRSCHRVRLRAAVIQMLAWSPQTLVIGHGHIISYDVPQRLRRAFAWLGLP